ncbi:MAG: methyltransferase [Deltaproteobacteria bacterium]|nr:methyltransferase [Deltaproteobacteria bacterium]
MNRIPFSDNELKVIGEYPVPFPGMPLLLKYNTPITPAQNYEMVIRGERPFWLPTMSDISMSMGGFLPDNEARLKGGKDFFGLEWVFVPVAGGATRKPGKPYITDMNTWKETITFPDLDQYDWKSYKDSIKPEEDRISHVTILNGIFERLISFMDFANAAMAIIDEDQEAAILEFFDKQADFYIKLVDKYMEYGSPRIISFHDDWGSQMAPFFSADTIRRMILPSLKRVLFHIQKRGAFVDMHSCGKTETLAPLYIEAGVQTWTPQPMNNHKKLYENYGDKLFLGISPPDIDPEISEEELYAALKDFIDYYCRPNKPPVAVFAMSMHKKTHPKLGEAIYKLSRIALNRLA